MGFDEIHIHNVGRNQAEFIDVFGREVLPEAPARLIVERTAGPPTCALQAVRCVQSTVSSASVGV